MDDGFTNLFDGRGRLQLSVQNSDQPAERAPRLHLDLYAADAALAFSSMQFLRQRQNYGLTPSGGAVR